jgi:hypothetical protein
MVNFFLKSKNLWLFLDFAPISQLKSTEKLEQSDYYRIVCYKTILENILIQITNILKYRVRQKAHLWRAFWYQKLENRKCT